MRTSEKYVTELDVVSYRFLLTTLSGKRPAYQRLSNIQCESKKIPPLRGPDISHFPHKRLRIFSRFFTHLLYVLIYARLQIFIQLSPTLTKLCHIKRNYAVHIICEKCPKRTRSDVCVSR